MGKLAAALLMALTLGLVACLAVPGAPEAEGGKLGKTMLKASSKVNAMLNNDASHIARMLIEGYEMGVVSLQKCVNEMQKEHDEVPPSAKELLKLYDKNVRALRKFL